MSWEKGIADTSTRPYNFKVWATANVYAEKWFGERVATVDCKRVISNVLHGKEDVGWGPNSVFRFSCFWWNWWYMEASCWIDSGAKNFNLVVL